MFPSRFREMESCNFVLYLHKTHAKYAVVCLFLLLFERDKEKGNLQLCTIEYAAKSCYGLAYSRPEIKFSFISSSPLKVHFSLSERSTHFSVLFQSLYSNQLLFHSRAQVPFFLNAIDLAEAFSWISTVLTCVNCADRNESWAALCLIQREL